MNGYEATERIRELEKSKGQHITIVAMTAHAMQGAREECLRHGMDGYLSKPINTEALWSELDNIGQGVSIEAEKAAPQQKGVVADFKRALKAMDDSTELFNEIVRLFLEDAPQHMQKIKEALANDDSKTVNHSAHTLKGMAGIFMAERLVQTAQRVEKIAGQEGCDAAVAELDRAFSEFLAALEELPAGLD